MRHDARSLEAELRFLYQFIVLKHPIHIHTALSVDALKPASILLIRPIDRQLAVGVARFVFLAATFAGWPSGAEQSDLPVVDEQPSDPSELRSIAGDHRDAVGQRDRGYQQVVWPNRLPLFLKTSANLTVRLGGRVVETK